MQATNPLSVLRDVPVLHWHGDTFDLPGGGGRVLASTSLCVNQAFSRGPNVLGLQLNPEVLGIRFEHWLLGHANELAAAGISPITMRNDARRYATGLLMWGAKVNHLVKILRGSACHRLLSKILSKPLSQYG